MPITGMLNVVTTKIISIYAKKKLGTEIRTYARKVEDRSRKEPLLIAALIPTGKERLHVIRVPTINNQRLFMNLSIILPNTG
jgi:hypothetical protein